MEADDFKYRVREGLRALLVPAGFEQVATDAHESGTQLNDRWERTNGWRIDVVDLHYRSARRPILIVNFDVFIQLLDGFRVDIDGQALPRLAGREKSAYHRKGLIGRLLAAGAAENPVEDASRCLYWFEEKYGTPKKCKEALLSPERNGVPVGHQPTLQFLESIMRS